MRLNKIFMGLMGLAVLAFPAPSQAGPTAEEYVAHIGKEAKLIPAGEFTLANTRLICGRRPTVLDPTLDDYGAAYPGFLIINPRLIAKVADPVKLWIYSHECAHQFRGPDEDTADCFAVQRGKRQGWLSPAGLNQVCQFISPAKGDQGWFKMHLSGSARCASMRQCYSSKKIH